MLFLATGNLEKWLTLSIVTMDFLRDISTRNNSNNQ